MSIPAIINPVYPIQPMAGQQENAQQFDQRNKDSETARQDLQTRRERPTTEYIYRGELLDAIRQQRHYRPQPNQHISPQSLHAIESYLASESLTDSGERRGRLLDRFV